MTHHSDWASATTALNTDKNGGIAQLGEHLLCKQGVSGSSPLTSIFKKNNIALDKISFL